MKLFDPEIGAVFEHRADAEAAVDELYDAGIADDHLWRMAHSSHRFVVDDDMDRVVFRAIAKGVMICLPIGALLGVALVALGTSGAGETMTSAAVLGGLFGGSMAGVFFGSVIGIARNTAVLYGHDAWEDVPLDADGMLVVAHTHGEPDVVREIFGEHRGRLIDAPA